MHDQDGQGMLTLQEYATKMRRPEATIRYWRHIGFGPAGRRIGRRVMYLEAEVDAWIEAQFSQSGGAA